MSEQTKFNKVCNALKTVPDEKHNMIMQMVNCMSEKDLAISFNQEAEKFFNSMVAITNRLPNKNEYTFDAYLKLFKLASRADIFAPVDQFSLVILEFAPQIYNEDAEYIINMDIPDGKIEAEKNQFEILKSDSFKKLWKHLKAADQDIVKRHILALTAYSHAYFFMTLKEKTKTKNL